MPVALRPQSPTPPPPNTHTHTHARRTPHSCLLRNLLRVHSF